MGVAVTTPMITVDYVASMLQSFQYAISAIDPLDQSLTPASGDRVIAQLTRESDFDILAARRRSQERLREVRALVGRLLPLLHEGIAYRDEADAILRRKYPDIARMLSVGVPITYRSVEDSVVLVRRDLAPPQAYTQGTI